MSEETNRAAEEEPRSHDIAESISSFQYESKATTSAISIADGVCGSAARIRGTRIPVWGLEEARRHGIPDDTILEMYPSITRPDLLAAWTYVASHREEIDALIESNSHE